MSFNLKKAKQERSVKPYSKYLTEDSIEPESKNTFTTTEANLPDRKGDNHDIVGRQIIEEHTNKEAQTIEYVLNNAKSWHPHRVKDSFEKTLYVPPINDLVERLRQARNSEYTVQKDSHWSTQPNTQNEGLPEWPKQAPQHDKQVVNNDSRRFQDESVKPLEGFHVKASDFTKVAIGIKLGSSSEYDNAIRMILKVANDERRELTDEEKSLVQDLKKDRTLALLGL